MSETGWDARCGRRLQWLRLAGAVDVAAVGIVTLARYYQQSCGL